MSNVDILLQQAVEASLGQTQASKQLADKVKETSSQIEATVASKIEQLDQWKANVKADQISGQARYAHDIDLTELPVDHFFPVWWKMATNEQGGCDITIARHYSRDHNLKPFGEGIVHVAGLLLQIEGCDSGWGGDAQYLQIKRLSQTYRETVRKVAHRMMCIVRPVDGSRPIYSGVTSGNVVACTVRSGCYLRGGLRYKVLTNWNADLKYSRELDEVEITRETSSKDNWEIKWTAKAYSIHDALLGERYPEIRNAFQQTNELLFEAKS
ncbi:hypothetical protein [Vibrio sp. AND4]|uniref:hypothetical protein n=1 Tax=Vibrio sp. AND4 TaxID=314289 RepID=UPI00015EFEFA|nr:hypothetical protein [Vibrio sp. AND4]EDP59432.1 hypothetical protein AND4_09672 [Vibrio sp. AND4]